MALIWKANRKEMEKKATVKEKKHIGSCSRFTSNDIWDENMALVAK